MLAINYTTMRNNLKEYCDRATDEGETIIVTRKADRNVVILSLEQYNQMEKEYSLLDIQQMKKEPLYTTKFIENKEIKYEVYNQIEKKIKETVKKNFLEM